MPRSKHEHTLPVNLFHSDAVSNIRKQQVHLSDVNISHINLLTQLSGKAISEGLKKQETETFPIFEYIRQRLEDNIDMKVPIVFYFAVYKIYNSLDIIGIKIDPEKIAISLGQIWPKIISELENKIADPSIIYGTDLFYDICKRAYLCHQGNNIIDESNIEYSHQMQTLLDDISEFAFYLPMIFLDWKSSSETQFNEYLSNKRGFKTLESLKTLRNKESKYKFPKVNSQENSIDFSNNVNAFIGYLYRADDKPSDFGVCDATLTRMQNNEHESLLSLTKYLPQDSWQEIEKMSWCYANAIIITEKKLPVQSAAIVAASLYFFQEKNSVISREFVEVSQERDSSLLVDAFQSIVFSGFPKLNLHNLNNEKDRTSRAKAIEFLFQACPDGDQIDFIRKLKDNQLDATKIAAYRKAAAKVYGADYPYLNTGTLTDDLRWTEICNDELAKAFDYKDEHSLTPLEFFNKTTTDKLLLNMSTMSESERSDWVEGLLLMHMIERGKLGGIDLQESDYLKKIKSCAFTHPLLFSKAYSSIENKYRERFKACSVIEKNKILSDSSVKMIFGKLKENAYANHIIDVMHLTIKWHETPWFHLHILLYLLICELFLYLYHYALELVSWSLNNKVQLLIALGITIFSSLVSPLFLLEYTIGLIISIEALIKATEDFFGIIGVYLLVNVFNSGAKAIAKGGLNHMADNFDLEKLKTELGINNLAQSNHKGKGFDFKDKASCRNDIIDSKTIDQLMISYRFLEKEGLLSTILFKKMKEQLLFIIFESCEVKSSEKFIEKIKLIPEKDLGIIKIILNQHSSKISSYFKSTTDSCDYLIDIRDEEESTYHSDLAYSCATPSYDTYINMSKSLPREKSASAVAAAGNALFEKAKQLSTARLGQ